MFFYLKKGFSILISLLYIFVNYNFYNSIFHEYANDKIFHITTELAVIEIIFWITLFYSIFQLENKEINKNKKIKTKDMKEKEVRKDKIELIICYVIFLISLICVNISRVILQSSPYMNDVVSTVSSYLLFFGGTRVVFIFSSIIFIFIAISRRNIFLILISALNIIISIMIWLDFDTSITSIMRIIISIFTIIYYLMENNKKINEIRRVNK
jgi:hypothetical protein